MALTDGVGATVERMEFADFGDPQFFNGAGAPLDTSPIANPWLGGGLFFDLETGLYEPPPLLLPPDYGGESKADIMVFVPRGGNSLPVVQRQPPSGFGGPTIPLVGDYNSDSFIDVIVPRDPATTPNSTLNFFSPSQSRTPSYSLAARCRKLSNVPSPGNPRSRNTSASF